MAESITDRVSAIEKSDPTALTSSQIFREVASLKELMEMRFAAMDKAVTLLQDISNRSPTVSEVYLQHEEKFASIQKQFEERDVRTEQAAKDSKVSVDAALAAQEKAGGIQAEAFQEATSKTEQQFTKQIDQQSELLRTEVRGLMAQINELKDRFNRGEGRGEGVDKSQTDHRASNIAIIAVIAAALSFLVGIGGLIIAVTDRVTK